MDRKTKRIEGLEANAALGANASYEFKLMSQAFIEQKGEVLDKFESKDTLEIDELQEAHRTYRSICKLEDFFMKRIKLGQEAENKLNSLKETTK